MRYVALGVVGAAAAGAAGQGLVVHNWRVEEVIAGTEVRVEDANGVIEPGEAARFTLSVEFDPPVGTIVPYTTPEPGVGPVAGLLSQCFALASPVGGEGEWSHVRRAEGWEGAFAAVPGFVSIQAWQDVEAGPMSAQNPVGDLWSAVWTPAGYEPRVVEWRSQVSCMAGTSKLAVSLGRDPGTGQEMYTFVRVPTEYGVAPVVIVPAPGTLALLAAAGLFVMRRRR